MKTKESHRKAFLALRELLQTHDPLGLMRQYGGDRFDAELYGYEATTILERFRTSPTVDGIADFLRMQADTRGHEKVEQVIITAAKACIDALRSCNWQG